MSINNEISQQIFTSKKPSQQQQQTSSIWLNNPLTNLFRRSGRKPKKEIKPNEIENCEEIFIKQKTKRSSSCDALHQNRLSTRFIDNQKQHQELFLNVNSKKEKDNLMNSTTKITRGGLNSSFSSLLHQRIFLSSRGASPFVPNKLNKIGKNEKNVRLPSKTRCTSKSQQNILRIIDTEEIKTSTNNRYSRRDLSLGASTPRISLDSQFVRQVPIHLSPPKNKKIIKNNISSLTKIITTSTTTLICPVTNGFQQQKENSLIYEFNNNIQQQQQQNNNNKQQQQYYNNNIEERNLALEKWMMTQPLSIRKFEKHERIRLKITEKSTIERGGIV
ncbi:hypothetical protein Mgra_00004466 [Meloidogyne graminicola]|uniref:Uncharacterized protein n=1 Tax=Meloidogyne graminicola TaxID=189291 RepID=A0A8S9ZRV2_9BILA|nr:hypothetical protein Mgra_00004466 [Meloidogyne graminicola]